MKTILTIDHTDYLLPKSANPVALMKMLDGTKRLRGSSRWVHDHYEHEAGDDARISLAIVPDDHIVPARKPKAIPEVAGPDVHNTFGSR